jgi:hypothetical protein
MPMHATLASSVDASDLPADAELVLSALDAAGAAFIGANQRKWERHRYRVRAELRLYSDPASKPTWTLYTRDINHRGLGFISRHRLPLGYGGQLALPDPSGRILDIPCTLIRCRQAAVGWFEGALYFNRDQHCFAAMPIDVAVDLDA